MCVSRIFAKICQSSHFCRHNRLLSTVPPPSKYTSFVQQNREFAFVKHMNRPAFVISFAGLILGSVSLVSSPTKKDMEKLIVVQEFEMEQRFQVCYEAVREEIDKGLKERMNKRRAEKKIRDLKIKMLGEAARDLELHCEIVLTEKTLLEEEKKELEKQLQKNRSKEEKKTIEH